MAKRISKPKRKAGKSRRPAKRQRKLSAEEIAKLNKQVADKRVEKLRELRKLLRDKKWGPILLDAETRGTAKKFASLPFGCITDSCAGHFMDSIKFGKKLPLEKIKPNQMVYSTGPIFELKLDFSPQATEFRKALKEFEKRTPFVHIVFNGIYGLVSMSLSRKLIDKKQAAEIRKLNLKFLEEFEKLVGSFAEKYGVKVRL